MDEAAYLADRLAIIVGGRIVAEGTPLQIAARASGVTAIHVRLPPASPELPLTLRENALTTGDGSLQIRAPDPTRTLHALTTWAIEHGVQLDELTVTRPSLEDAYLELTGERAAAGRVAA